MQAQAAELERLNDARRRVVSSIGEIRGEIQEFIGKWKAGLRGMNQRDAAYQSAQVRAFVDGVV